MNGPKTRPLYNRWFLSNFDKRYEITSNLISVMWAFQKCRLQYFRLIFTKIDHFTNNRPKKRVSLKSLVQIEFGEKLWSQLIKILAFKYQPCEHFIDFFLFSLNWFFEKKLEPKMRFTLSNQSWTSATVVEVRCSKY